MKPSSNSCLEDSRKPSSAIENQNKDEGVIWEAFKEGNESAFIFIYETYFDQLFLYGNQFTRNEDIVKDAIQDLFIELRKSRSRRRRTESIKIYLHKGLKPLIIKEPRQWFNQCEELNSKRNFDFAFCHEQLLIERQSDEEKAAILNTAI